MTGAPEGKDGYSWPHLNPGVNNTEVGFISGDISKPFFTTTPESLFISRTSMYILLSISTYLLSNVAFRFNLYFEFYLVLDYVSCSFINAYDLACGILSSSRSCSFRSIEYINANGIPCSCRFTESPRVLLCFPVLLRFS